MSVFFAMVADADGIDRAAFFLREDQAPDGAVAITGSRHVELLEAQADGRSIVADAKGKPKVERLRVTAAAKREALTIAIRNEAAKRIAIISPAWRQMNDIRDPSVKGAARFAQIDAVRAASDRIEALANDLAVADLQNFPVSDHPFWPEFD